MNPFTSLLDKVEAVFHHAQHTQQLAAVLAVPTAEEGPHIMAINLAQLEALPNIVSGLASVFQATGSVTAQNLLAKAQDLLKAVSLDSASVASFNGEVNNFVSLFGELVPGAALSNVKAAIAKYENDLTALAAGQNLQVAEVGFTLNGQNYEAVVSVSLKQETAPVA